MPATPKTANVLKTLESNTLLPPQISLNHVALHCAAQLLDFIVCQVLGSGVRIYPGTDENLLRSSQTNSINVG